MPVYVNTYPCINIHGKSLILGYWQTLLQILLTYSHIVQLLTYSHIVQLLPLTLFTFSCPVRHPTVHICYVCNIIKLCLFLLSTYNQYICVKSVKDGVGWWLIGRSPDYICIYWGSGPRGSNWAFPAVTLAMGFKISIPISSKFEKQCGKWTTF